MGSTKHERSFVDYDKGYETNIIGLRGIIYFGVGLFLLIVVTFALMWFFQNFLEDQARSADAQSRNPMTENLEKTDRLPPEPRLQSAPGFRVGEGKDEVNLELTAPQSEYWELEKRWAKELKEGQRDEKTGTVVTLGIEDAKKRLLEQNPKARAGADPQKTLDQSRMIYSYSSAGRVASDRIR